MGNCLFGGGLGEGDDGVIKVVTSNGGIMELLSPITAGSITSEFPGHGIFRSHDLFWKPLSQHEDLLAGQSYYLLPLHTPTAGGPHDHDDDDDQIEILGGQIVKQGHVRSNSIPTASLAAPYRMSLDYHYQGMLLRRSYTEPFSTSRPHNMNPFPFWKVKLVISPEQLLEILSQEGPTQELIESVRTVAKCGSSAALSAVAFSDHWSLSSSSCRNTSSKTDCLLDI
ncbi:uncharacterized protein LOC107403795 [Ziziphus jujuba]|uniref:Uncharacterized protein LOC107403795 n=2 Tax=Ziziphus jujuba TaxID=326968 RepID=A0A6P3YW04_ZIZJJ|nr:uncharacterized protein LOC107403795 [Ziziphus jujuba]KAH7513642.1 hypothetical protein FEM48_Zijuj11G0002600 [Ziziphus jujuba var. spinosa]